GTVQRHVEAGTTHQIKLAPFDALIACIVFTNNYLGYLKDHKLAFNRNCDTVWVSARIHLEQTARFLNIEKQQILEINPAVLSDVIYGDMKPRRLILPESYGVVFNLKADSIIAFTDSIYFSKPEKPSFVENKIAYTIPGNDYEKISYTIQSGDNLGLIAEKFDVKINDLREWNDISGNTIYAGKTLVIYVKKGSSFESNAAGTQANNPAHKGEPSILQGYILFDTYVVKKGDSPYTIAAQYPGVSAENIMEWNNISNPSKIQIGQTLKIYKKR
ncbi:MAG TPA: LysM peptidoglycan-binding domain-containing protein, partial [Bacteroidales bacterium]|nr:LysM peptidoglycan-binding domain-containing protein [Bacteroidales bacterium]